MGQILNKTEWTILFPESLRIISIAKLLPNKIASTMPGYSSRYKWPNKIQLNMNGVNFEILITEGLLDRLCNYAKKALVCLQNCKLTSL